MSKYESSMTFLFNLLLSLVELYDQLIAAKFKCCNLLWKHEKIHLLWHCKNRFCATSKYSVFATLRYSAFCATKVLLLWDIRSSFVATLKKNFFCNIKRPFIATLKNLFLRDTKELIFYDITHPLIAASK